MPGSRSAGAVAPVVPVARWHVLGVRAFAGVVLVVLVAGAVSDGRLATAPRVVLAVAGVVLGTLTVWVLLRWLGRDRSERSVLLWPGGVLLLLVVLNLVSPLTARELPGVFTLAFLFVGLSQRPGTVWWCLPIALVPYVWVLQIDLDVSLVRIPVIVAVWTLVAEVPARLLGLLRVQAEELSRTASTDALTGLANRADLDRTLAALGAQDALGILDLDHFKRYNDTFGHPSGDVLLRDFADCLRESARSGDRLFRYGGEEFLLVLPRTTPAAGAAVLHRIADHWRQTRPDVTFSAGVASAAGPDPLGTADALLYQAKEQGRDRVVAQADAADPDASEASLPQEAGS